MRLDNIKLPECRFQIRMFESENKFDSWSCDHACNCFALVIVRGSIRQSQSQSGLELSSIVYTYKTKSLRHMSESGLQERKYSTHISVWN